jgi:sporulation protein YlmC with PRC-barrel domain
MVIKDGSVVAQAVHRTKPRRKPTEMEDCILTANRQKKIKVPWRKVTALWKTNRKTAGGGSLHTDQRVDSV